MLLIRWLLRGVSLCFAVLGITSYLGDNGIFTPMLLVLVAIWLDQFSGNFYNDEFRNEGAEE
jgi:hypothetical protein